MHDVYDIMENALSVWNYNVAVYYTRNSKGLVWAQFDTKKYLTESQSIKVFEANADTYGFYTAVLGVLPNFAKHNATAEIRVRNWNNSGCLPHWFVKASDGTTVETYSWDLGQWQINQDKNRLSVANGQYVIWTSIQACNVVLKYRESADNNRGFSPAANFFIYPCYLAAFKFLGDIRRVDPKSFGIGFNL